MQKKYVAPELKVEVLVSEETVAAGQEVQISAKSEWVN